jgi:hypothetical protein
LQYPTVYGGTVAAPATPGESAIQVNSHFIVLETERDPALESEASAAYPGPLTVAFAVAPWTWACLNDINASISSHWSEAQKAGITVYSNGIGRSRVIVGVSACTPFSKQVAKEWFLRRWGTAVSVQTCQKPAVAT